MTLLAQRPITLVLMVINSYSYSLLMIQYLISLRYLIKILVGDQLQQRSLELTHVDSRVRASRSHLALGWSQARWIAFGSSWHGDKKTSVCVQFSMFRPCVKVESIDMLKFTRAHTQVSICLVFGLTGFDFHIYGFHGQIESKQVYIV